MKKLLLLLVAAATIVGVSAQTRYNPDLVKKKLRRVMKVLRIRKRITVQRLGLPGEITTMKGRWLRSTVFLKLCLPMIYRQIPVNLRTS